MRDMPVGACMVSEVLTSGWYMQRTMNVTHEATYWA